ncbi:polysaccharide pyruvyl transferase family protein [Pseudomonas sp.]|uniref:polysaccharide pyruvyl transferase family protein n=1 Tax=Pseudomonas sp. TaxID=306 RepID=UPI002C8A7D24|nr:polysaccharide pyruvyl transferase family protein [Pseudomonas sp.]HUE91179.1 polysaccharide pyruvyl transferase family protein [Pseudomonas sp.]
MKKIALVTIHNAGNYGASLQAFASQEVLSRFGAVEIIDYRSDYLSINTKLFRFSFKFRAMLRVGKDVFRFFNRRRILGKFNDFTRSKLCLSAPYTTKELYSATLDYDYYVSGSDQIWNPTIVSEVDALDPIFLLDFVESGRKVSYASSAGSYVFTAEKANLISAYLSTYHAISVREKTLSDRLESLLGFDVPSVLDPTLMLTKHEWLRAMSLGQAQKKNPFILVYALKPDRLFCDVVGYISAKLGLEVITIDQSPFLKFKSDQHIKDAGPEQYINYFATADFVVTNSFHGTVFSTNFNIPFVSVKPIHGQNRITDFLKLVGLSERFIQDIRDVEKISLDVSFLNSDCALGNERARCYQVLDGFFNTVEKNSHDC